jgi:hypothetical protein
VYAEQSMPSSSPPPSLYETPIILEISRIIFARSRFEIEEFFSLLKVRLPDKSSSFASKEVSTSSGIDCTESFPDRADSVRPDTTDGLGSPLLKRGEVGPQPLTVIAAPVSKKNATRNQTDSGESTHKNKESPG